MTCSHLFSRAWRKLHVFGCWLVHRLAVFVVIGQGDYLGFTFTTQLKTALGYLSYENGELICILGDGIPIGSGACFSEYNANVLCGVCLSNAKCWCLVARKETIYCEKTNAKNFKISTDVCHWNLSTTVQKVLKISKSFLPYLNLYTSFKSQGIKLLFLQVLFPKGSMVLLLKSNFKFFLCFALDLWRWHLRIPLLS